MKNSGRTEEGKIKGDGTPEGVGRSLHMGLGGTLRCPASAAWRENSRKGCALPRAVRAGLRSAAPCPALLSGSR